MDLVSVEELKRLEKQIFSYKTNIKSSQQKQYVSSRLRNQLVESKPIVRIQRMDAECESLMISLKQRLMLLQDILIPMDKEFKLSETENRNVLKERAEVKLNLSDDSSDDEKLSKIMFKTRDDQNLKMCHKSKTKTMEMQQVHTSAPSDSSLPLALRKQSRERKLSYKSYSSASTSNSKANRIKLHNKQEHAVTTSGVSFNNDEMMVEQEEVDTPTLHIKIPSLHRGNVHYIVLDSLNFARKVFDYRANEIKNQQHQKSIFHKSKITKSHKTQLKSSNAPVLHELIQQENELEFSQLIQDVMAEACSEETLQATSALENINKNIVDNYDIAENDTLITYSQSSQELSYAQNTKEVEMTCSTSKRNNVRKKPRKSIKRTNDQLIEPPKKRGRKPKKKNDPDSAELQPQPPTKSNLAKYVEFFSNDCELMPGSSTPAASSTRSQPLVSSTTHNFEVVEQREQEPSSHQSITYYIDGDWANGGPCQLVPTNQDDVNAPFQEFVNYVDNNGDSSNNAIASVLECNNSLPISIPLPIANLGLQHKNNHQASHQIHYQSTARNPLVPVINIQIPTLPSNATFASEPPPPAHKHKEALDLSFKHKTSANVSLNEAFNHNQTSHSETFCISEDGDSLPLDLSSKGNKEKHSENNCVTIDTQDEDFIRRLIEQSDFDYGAEELKKVCHGKSIAYDHDNNKSFKAALDMPLLELDATDLEHLAQHTAATTNNQQKILTDKIVCKDVTNIKDCNYESVISLNSSIENNVNFSNQSATDIFNKLLDICPTNQFVYNEFRENDDLNESVFDQCRVKDSILCEVESLKTQMNQFKKKEKEACNTTLEEDNYEIASTLNDEPSTSTSLAVQIDTSNTTTDMSIDMSLNLKLSEDSNSREPKDVKLKETINLLNSPIVEINKPISNAYQSQMEDEETKLIEATHTNANEMCLSLNEEILLEIGNSKTISKYNPLTKDLDIKNFLETSNSKSKYINNKKDNDRISDYLHSSINDTQKCKYEANTKTTCITNGNNNDADNTLLPKVNDDNAAPLLMFSSAKSKPKPNVVFSVAKITLSEDDNLYSNDSDSSSGKSYDLSEIKSMDTDANIKKELLFSYKLSTHPEGDIQKQAHCHNIGHTYVPDTLLNGSKFIEKLVSPSNDNENSIGIIERNVKEPVVIESKDRTENDKEELNMYHKQVNNPQTVENNAEQEFIDTTKNVKCSKDKTKNDEIKGVLDSKIANVTCDNLTLLELESKLESSLDFDEDYDDALSLATSCFDSPTDERFEDSVVEIDITNPPQVLQNIDICPCPPPVEDFKHFKIPKLSNSKDTSDMKDTMIRNKPEEIKCGNFASTDSVSKTDLPMSIEKITRTVKNDFAQLNAATDKSIASKDLDDTTILKNIIFKIFGITCLPFLVDNCYALPHCQLSHQLNDIDKVYQSLNTLNKIEVNLAYQVLYNHSKLFRVYFEVFCAYYSSKNDRIKLLNAANDCERYPEYAESIIVIYEALVKCGLSRVNACRLILKRIREKSVATTIIEALVAIIMKSDWTMFTDIIERYTQDIYKFNFRIGILEQMVPAVLNSKGPHLKQIFGKCVQTLHCDDTSLLLNSPTLIQCVALLTTSTQ